MKTNPISETTLKTAVESLDKLPGGLGEILMDAAAIGPAQAAAVASIINTRLPTEQEFLAQRAALSEIVREVYAD